MEDKPRRFTEHTPSRTRPEKEPRSILSFLRLDDDFRPLVRATAHAERTLLCPPYARYMSDASG